MTNQLIADVFKKYYDTKLLESVIGGMPNSNIVTMLSSIMSTTKIILQSSDVTKNWFSNSTITYYTAKMHDLIQYPKFSGDNEEWFLNRLNKNLEALTYGGQSYKSLQVAIGGLLRTAILNPFSDITFITIEDHTQWKNELEDPDAYWSIGGYVWGTGTESMRSSLIIRIKFAITGSNSDPTTYNYWNLPANYTKIADIVTLFITPGSNYELLLVSP
jgi:hypothetical protein